MQAVFALALSAVISAACAAPGVLTLSEGTDYWLPSAEDHDGVVSFKTTASESFLISLSEGETRVIATPIDKGLDTPIVADVASNATLTLNAAVTARCIVKRGLGRMVVNAAMTLPDGITAAGGVVSVRDASYLEGVSAFHFQDGTFEFAGNGAGEQQTMPCPLVCESSMSTNVLDMKIESPLVVTNIDLRAGCILKRGVGMLTFMPAPGETMTLTCSNGNYERKALDAGDLSAEPYVFSSGKWAGFNIAEGGVTLTGGAGSKVSLPHSVQLGAKATNRHAEASLVVSGVEAGIADSRDAKAEFSMGVDWAFGYYPRFEVLDGASVVSRAATTGNYMWTTCVVDAASWQVTLNLYLYGHADNYGHPVFIVRNGAKLLPSEDSVPLDLAIYNGHAEFIVTDSVLARYEDLKPFSFTMQTGQSKFNFGENSTVSVCRFDLQAGKEVYGSRESIILDGTTWFTDPAKWQLFRLRAAECFIITTLREAGAVFPVSGENTLYVGRAISGVGGIAKTGTGTLHFEKQGTWDELYSYEKNGATNWAWRGSSTYNNVQYDWEETKLEDPVSLAFEGTLDVREGQAIVENGCCRTGGPYRAGAGASIDFDGNDLGSGAKFSGAGTFVNATATDATIFVPLGNDLVATDGSPTFDRVTLNGTVFLDFGSGIEPLGRSRSVVVATFVDPSAMPRSFANWTHRRVAKGYGVFLSKSNDGRSVIARIEKLGLRLKLM